MRSTTTNTVGFLGHSTNAAFEPQTALGMICLNPGNAKLNLFVDDRRQLSAQSCLRLQLAGSAQQALFFVPFSVEKAVKFANRSALQQAPKAHLMIFQQNAFLKRYAFGQNARPPALSILMEPYLSSLPSVATRKGLERIIQARSVRSHRVAVGLHQANFGSRELESWPL